MPGENLTRIEAQQRRAIVDTQSYEIALDLTKGAEVFGSRTVVRFTATEGASTFIDLIAGEVREITLNGVALEPASVFADSRIGAITHYPEAGREQHGKPPGSVMTVAFELLGQPMLALNGGPHFKFSPALSLMVLCDTQDEIDHYWHALSQGGDPAAQECGWLKDRYGLSWQITPTIFQEMEASTDRPAVERCMAALMKMKKLDIARLRQAFDGR